MKHINCASFLNLFEITFAVLLLLLAPSYGAINYLTEYDKVRLGQVIAASWSSNDLASIHYAAAASKLLGQKIPNSESVCKFLLETAKTQSSVESYYYTAQAWTTIGNCRGAFPTSEISKVFNDVMQKETSTIPDLYYSVLGMKSLGQQLKHNAKVVKTVQSGLKKDDSIVNIAYTLHIASQMSNEGAFAFDRIEDVLVQADEIDGRFLQFEGGLSITALVISGIFNLAETVKKAPLITPQQTVKFANYFVSRKSVQSVKGVHSLINVVTILSQNNFQTHVSLSIIGNGAVSVEQPRISVLVCDLLGNPITVPIAVTLEQATRLSDGVAVISNRQFTQTSEKMVYSVLLVEPTGELPGTYRLTVSVTASASSKLIGNIAVPLDVKVMAQAVFPEPLLIGTADSDQITQPKFHKVTHPNKLKEVLEVDFLQKLAMRFSLKEKITGKPLKVHQAFVKLQHKNSGQEVIFVAEKDTGVMYKLDLDIGSKVNELGKLSGLYSVDLIIGDTILTNSFSWHVADVKLNLGTVDKKKPSTQSIFKPKPEIQHLFREPERRPPVLVSNLFTGLVFVPLLILFALWAKLGVNISNFSFSLSTFGFHAGLGAIFCLFGMFWLKLNMFETLKYLLVLGLITFLSGNKLLANIASNQKR
ncbi:dolichyl-diphosphooligosaccharide--protein glycosyltransferase subunit 2 [Cimex lectularius]|uniref:Dolichyl-diphosphooligosaccharide--protein glycosyltransferase subunit 2 n=1 Tax=Cimex lectularius TaxID=79782 RepID=A0A8I6R8G9_CIMLE|nr:dolichyl-diphosphooligosaccharide--protein glycosyltransferase subunit 2 [Cimex lectularius]